MVTKWEYSPRLEALRLLHTAKNIANGFCRLNGFYPVPTDSPYTGDNIVYLPDLSYLTIPRFWEKAGRIDLKTTPSLKMTVPENLVVQTQKLLSSLPLTPPDYSAVQKTWGRRQDQIIHEIYTLVPHTQNTIKTLTIWPTAFGTSCSFNNCDPSDKTHNITIWLRSDQDISTIVEAILTTLTRQDIYNKLGGLWSESEIIVDFLMAYSPLAKLLPNPPKTIKSTRTLQSASLAQASQAFLTKIGSPTVSPRSLDPANLTASEKHIFNLLLSRSPSVVTFDELANPENFSLYAISKSIQRLRDKLESSGISGSFIQTKRGEGYLLIN